MFRRGITRVINKMYAKLASQVPEGYNEKLGTRKEKLFSEMFTMAQDLRKPLDVLEIGTGSGANFEYFPKGTNVTCTDPNPYFESYIRANAKHFPDINISQFLVCKAEDLSPVLNSSVDAVVCTLVLCSVDDVGQCLQEFKRVLRQGGKLFYLEHVLADEKTLVYKMQKTLNPIWRINSFGCNINRPTWRYINEAGFSKVQQERFTVEIKNCWQGMFFPCVIRPHVIGVATK